MVLFSFSKLISVSFSETVIFIWPVTSVCIVGKFSVSGLWSLKERLCFQRNVFHFLNMTSHKLYLFHIYADNPWSDEININEHACYNVLLTLCYIFCNVLFYVLL
jgi:hypothetical protein